MRLDKYLAEKYGSRTKAERAISDGDVFVNGHAVNPAYDFKDGDEITFNAVKSSFVSVGGYKLEKALNDFSVDVSGKVIADIGASTGGFTDCLLKRGAAKVYCIDVGESLLDKSLLDKDVVVIDNFNARQLQAGMFSEPLDGIVADVSFISLTYILGGVAKCLPEGAFAITLIKPQFELEKSLVGKNGIVKDRKCRAAALRRVYECAASNDLAPVNITTAPEVKGKNVEYPLLLVKGGKASSIEQLLKCVNL